MRLSLPTRSPRSGRSEHHVARRTPIKRVVAASVSFFATALLCFGASVPAHSASPFPPNEKPKECYETDWNLWQINCDGWNLNVTNNSGRGMVVSTLSKKISPTDQSLSPGETLDAGATDVIFGRAAFLLDGPSNVTVLFDNPADPFEKRRRFIQVSANAYGTNVTVECGTINFDDWNWGREDSNTKDRNGCSASPYVLGQPLSFTFTDRT